jgi:two-component system invasion response regulator UvrY
MIKVFIVDDHEIIRAGLKKILNEETDFVVVGEARNGDEVLRNIQNIDCDIMLLDLNMPGRCGLDLIADLKRLKQHMYILVLSVYSEDKFTLRLLKAGASGYVCKAVALHELAHAIRKVSLTGRYLSVNLIEQLAIDFIPGNIEKLLHESLSSVDL